MKLTTLFQCLPLLTAPYAVALPPGQGHPEAETRAEQTVSPPQKAASKGRAPSAKEREAMVRVQAFLDTALFSPGKLDGLPGELTNRAILCYQQAHGHEVNGLAETLPIPKDSPVYTDYTIKPDDRKFVGQTASRPQEQARLQYMPYESLAEFLTERFHCSMGLLENLNPETNLNKIKVGDTVRVPAVEPFQIEDVRAIASLPEKPEFKDRSIRVNRKDRHLDLFEGESLIASVPITPGSQELPTPAGKWRISAISTMPTFRWDEGVLNHGVRTDQFYMIPPGPNNPVGVVWCALNRSGIGIHGTNQPETIGRAHSHGCMRVANWDVIRLIQKVTPGIPVIIE